MRSHTYFSVPGVAKVRWDEVDQAVLVVWEGWANSTEFSALLDAEIKALSENGCSRLLADCRLQRILNPADQERANREWIPKAAAAGLKRFAIVLPVSDLAASHIRQRTENSPYEVSYFDEPEKALSWLRS